MFSATRADSPFISGNGIAARCGHVLNYDSLEVNEGGEADWWFCKSDWLEYFFREIAPPEPYVLFSHNSDRAIGRHELRFLRRGRRPVAWFAANAAAVHARLHGLPLGVANPHWPHGDVDVLAAVQRAQAPKTRLFDVSYSLRTNQEERAYCVARTGLEPEPARGFRDYLEGLASSSFCIAPRGNGIDTHRIWEALYLRTIPVVTRSVLTDQHPDLPLLILDDWADFGSVDFSPELYDRHWGDWDPAEIALDRYFDRVSAIIARTSGGAHGSGSGTPSPTRPPP